ncbi:hypothetical protein BD770DRAFT_376794 [Pilaira anomala]|nr:hypothetical protein BD770DRAFT_376794 [Pilaira anomala]
MKLHAATLTPLNALSNENTYNNMNRKTKMPITNTTKPPIKSVCTYSSINSTLNASNKLMHFRNKIILYYVI